MNDLTRQKQKQKYTTAIHEGKTKRLPTLKTWRNNVEWSEDQYILIFGIIKYYRERSEVHQDKNQLITYNQSSFLPQFCRPKLKNPLKKGIDSISKLQPKQGNSTEFYILFFFYFSQLERKHEREDWINIIIKN